MRTAQDVLFQMPGYQRIVSMNSIASNVAQKEKIEKITNAQEKLLKRLVIVVN